MVLQRLASVTSEEKIASLNRCSQSGANFATAIYARESGRSALKPWPLGLGPLTRISESAHGPWLPRRATDSRPAAVRGYI